MYYRSGGFLYFLIVMFVILMLFRFLMPIFIWLLPIFLVYWLIRKLFFKPKQKTTYDYTYYEQRQDDETINNDIIDVDYRVVDEEEEN